MPVEIDAPAIEPYKYGLFGSTQQRTWDPHFGWGGAQWETLAQYLATPYPVGPDQAGGAGGDKVLSQPNPYSMALPFAIYAGIECGSIGYTPAEFETRAKTVLDLAAQNAVEQQLWAGISGGSPSLNGDPSVTLSTTVTGSATDLVTALALLENWLGANYSGVGYIHAMRGVAILGANKRLVKHVQEPDELVTPLGTEWVFGGGYDGSGPDNASPATGQTWIYATGQIVIARDTPNMPANFEQSLDRLHNTENIVVEQPYLVGVDGTWAAALVDLTL